MDNSIFSNSIKYDDNAKRNITYVAKAASAFSTLTQDEEDITVVLAASDLARTALSTNDASSDFYYTAAIGYPFQAKNFMRTRYSDGSFPVWYGSKTVETSIYETVHHAVRFLMSEEGVLDEDKVVKKRTVFNVFCSGILLDLTTSVVDYSSHGDDDYEFSNRIGKEIQNGGLPGVLYPSKRHAGGINLGIFTQSVLHDPQIQCQLKYSIYPKKRFVEIEWTDGDIIIPF